MNVGMLWLDADSKRSLEEKVRRAADYYCDKYGRLPELCLINSKMSEFEGNVGRIEVKGAETVLPYHFWLGMKA
jgi:hypothetical protein